MAATMQSMPSPTTFTPLQPDYQGSSATGAGAGAVSQRSSGAPIGTFFAVLAAVLVLTLLSCIFGRVFAELAEGPDERYDCGRLARRWCWWGRLAGSSGGRRSLRRPWGGACCIATAGAMKS